MNSEKLKLSSLAIPIMITSTTPTDSSLCKMLPILLSAFNELKVWPWVSIAYISSMVITNIVEVWANQAIMTIRDNPQIVRTWAILTILATLMSIAVCRLELYFFERVNREFFTKAWSRFQCLSLQSRTRIGASHYSETVQKAYYATCSIIEWGIWCTLSLIAECIGLFMMTKKTPVLGLSIIGLLGSLYVWQYVVNDTTEKNKQLEKDLRQTYKKKSFNVSAAQQYAQPCTINGIVQCEFRIRETRKILRMPSQQMTDVGNIICAFVAMYSANMYDGNVVFLLLIVNTTKNVRRALTSFASFMRQFATYSTDYTTYDDMIKKYNHEMSIARPQQVPITYPWKIQDIQIPIGDRKLSGRAFTIAAGDCIHLIGVSGSGKTTLINHLTGSVPGNHESGIRLESEEPIRQFQDSILLYVQSSSFELGTATWERVFGTDVEPNDEAFVVAEIADKAREVYATNDFANLSGGEQTRIMIAQRLIMGKEQNLYIFDEADKGLDAETGMKVLRNICRFCKKKGKSLIFTSHLQHIVKEVPEVTKHINIADGIVTCK
jgi:putative ABC transport system ATP-binding protein